MWASVIQGPSGFPSREDAEKCIEEARRKKPVGVNQFLPGRRTPYVADIHGVNNAGLRLACYRGYKAL